MFAFRRMPQSNLLFNAAFIAVIIYQQYLLYNLNEENITQQNQINKIILHDVKYQDDAMIVGKEIPPTNVIHNSYLTLRSPKQKEGLQAEQSKEVNRGNNYGGKGDAEHLGGFTARDNSTISENVWNFMLSQLGVKSVLDIGCGKGFSSSYFLSKGARVLCVEGSRDAIQNSLLPFDKIVQHDFSRGAWWPEETFDVAWSTEFLEHVGRQYMKNYMPAFAKSALVMVTASGWGGWHHVEVHDQKWWIGRFQAMGFVFSPEITEWVRYQAFPDGYDGRALILKHGLLVGIYRIFILLHHDICTVCMHVCPVYILSIYVTMC